MNSIIKKPHLFFFWLIPIFILLGLLKRDIPIDINISYIHYLINVDFWCYITAVYFGLMGINYLSLHWAKKHPNNWLTSAHIILQVACLIPYLISVFNLDKSGNLIYTNLPFQENLNIILLVAFFIFLISILIHLINFFTSLLLKRD
ncbi:hypothetical protein [Polaribacter porphyrae]|uniref:Uncharacterized protein n=1 Tax=Polaribacter porphyrae TaxID=1137780 RepID=A0A2S7WKM4_9FLAO|nr:hypothetical protein [Polaribacter porphyrae]PQJ78155.1 hypothetical protein BTO18_02645 [Polaribacter porphyrae]